MAEWIYEAGIGECRAALVDQGFIIEACIEPEQDGPRAGAIVDGRLRADRIVELESGHQALLDFAPEKVTQGARLRVEITRASLYEPGKAKRAKARAVSADEALSPGQSLWGRISGSNDPVTIISPQGPNAFEEAGWSELVEQAQTGIVPFAGGALQISLTPAMTLIDIDGQAPVAELALQGIVASAQAIRRFGLSGSIGIDVPTLNDRALRASIAKAMTDLLERPYEATAINGFGFMQIIRPRRRASLMEIIQYDRVGAAARATLRRAQRSGLTGSATLIAAPRVITELESHPDWLATLSAHIGGTLSLQTDPTLSIDGGYAHSS